MQQYDKEYYVSQLKIAGSGAKDEFIESVREIWAAFLTPDNEKVQRLDALVEAWDELYPKKD